MGTATILGDTYTTAVMPDGREWLETNFRHAATPGFEVDNNAGNRAEWGRLYRYSDIMAATLPDGWRVPTRSDWVDLIGAVGAEVDPFIWIHLKSGGLTYWNNDAGYDSYGFAARGTGYCNTAPVFAAFRAATYFGVADPVPGEKQILVLSTTVASASWNNDDGDAYGFSYRLVREYVPPPITATIYAEAHETTHALALEWTEAADGTPVAYDDGAAYDYIESTITARLTPSELATLESAWQSSTKLYTIISTGYLLGPLIDMSAGVEVRLMSYQVDQSADSAMTLYDVTIGVHYGPLSAPSAGSLAVVQSRGRPYHSVAPGAASWITEGGTSDVNAYGRASERSCTWYTHSLTTAQAADVINALRTLRGSSTTWTAGGVATPWGPGEFGTATVWIPEWSVHRESNLLWGVQMELVRNG